MEISVCIPAFNETAHLTDCVESIRRSFAALRFSDYEIVVCDNNSTDGTGDLARTLGARVIYEPHNQIARARNAAGGAAVGKWLIFIDADSLLSPELLSATFTAMDDPLICGGGATIQFDDEISSFVRRGLAMWTFVSKWMNWAAGSYVFCLREAWRDTGGFGEEFYAGEEIEFSRRLHRWGRRHKKRFRVLHTSAIVTSGRKMKMFSEGQLRQAAWQLLRPGGLRRRENCGIWYER